MSEGASRALVPVPSVATHVTFFEDRAEVTRRAHANLPAGVSTLSLTGITAMIDGASLVAAVVAGGERARVVAAKVVRQLRHVRAAPETEIAAAELDFRAARRRAADAKRAVLRAVSDEERAVALSDGWSAALARVPRSEGDGGFEPTRRSIEAAWQALWKATTDALDAVAAARAELERARLDVARAELRLAQARTLEPRYEASVELQIAARDAHEVDVDLTYRTPCALWRPEHVARLIPLPAGGHDLRIVTTATAWQRTGEDWTAVLCRFSTARPAQAASPPLLTDDVLQMRRRLDRAVEVEARDQSIALAGLGRGARAVDEMPGVDDGGQPLTFEAPRPITIPSDGQPFRQPLGELTLGCQTELVAYPERDEAAHLRATATLRAPTPLLAGPVRVARGGEMVGRGKVSFVAAGEPFELGFGADDAIRIRRRVDEQRDVAPLTGKQTIERTVTLYLSNLGGNPKHLRVVERYPVSEIADLTVTVRSSAGAQLDAKSGFAGFSVDLAPRATKELSFSYRIEATSKVHGV